MRMATVTLECLPEHVRIAGNASAIDDDTDRETERWIESQLARGNDWAWCCARVTLTFADLAESDTLGCCSFRSEGDFRRNCYADMLNNVASALATRIHSSPEGLAALLLGKV